MSTNRDYAGPIMIHDTRDINGTSYLVSNKPALISLDFVTATYNSDAMYWTEAMDQTIISLMVANSSVLGVYKPKFRDDAVDIAHSDAESLTQVGMARLVTDYVTHAYLTDVLVVPDERKKGLGTWLLQCCNDFIDKIPFLQKAMLATSNPKRNARFYQEQLGMSIPRQDPENHLILMKKGFQAKNNITMEGKH